MATINVLVGKTIASINGSTVNGEWVRTSGYPVTVQVLAPASLVGVEQSNDGFNAVQATHQNGTAITAFGSGMFTLDDRAEWVRALTTTDASGPRNFEFMFTIQKEL